MSEKTTIFILIVVTAVTLFFGLRVKERIPDNRAESGNKGLEFKDNSIVYSGKGFLTSFYADGEFSIELSIIPEKVTTRVFRFILLVSDGNEKTQLLIGQWENAFVVMNGHDYGNFKREPKIYATFPNDGSLKHVLITTGEEGTSLYIDGKKAGENRRLHLKMPENAGKSRLVLGNGMTCKNPWHGIISHLSIYSGKGKTLAGYDFRQGAGTNLVIPKKVLPLKKEFLQLPRADRVGTPGFITDFLLNLLGFIPLGISAAAVCRNFVKKDKRKAVFIMIMSVFFVSLFIETLQVWIPGRNSSLLDLLLNTAGGAAGILLFNFKICPGPKNR